MIRIEFQEPNTPEWRAWRKQCQNEQRNHNAKIEAGQTAEPKRSVYKGKDYDIKARVYMDVQGPFRGKCAYCEQKIYGSQHGDMEHFRPKSAVSDESFEPALVDENGSVRKHPGYYWLCYDWRNLLPACVLCNQESRQGSDSRRIGKHTRFPVRGFRAVKPGDEAKEEPMLVNPVSEDPQEHLRLESNGSYTWLTDRGHTCVDIFGLNDRDLPHDRRAIYKNVIEKMGLLSQALAIEPNGDQAHNLIKEILEHKNGRHAFTAAALKAIKDAVRNQDPLRKLAVDLESRP